MRSLALSLFMFVSAAPAFAQYGNVYSCEVVLIDNYNRVIDRFIAQRDYQTNRCRDGLRDCNKEMRLRGISGRCVESDNIPSPQPQPQPNPYPYPNPQPNPNPYPNPGPGNYGMEVTAIVENRLVVLQGYSRGDLFNQCMQQVPNLAVDEITMVTNNSSTRRLVNNTSYWNRTADICNVIMTNISNEVSYSSFIDVFGTLENRSLSIRTSSKADALSQCYSQAASIGSIDDISISVNNSQLRQLRNNSSYWKNAGEICFVVMQQIDQVVR
ncbi:MAG: hypothetical protein ACOVP4_00680 [Bacteriovoracaceae bacterium]